MKYSWIKFLASCSLGFCANVAKADGYFKSINCAGPTVAYAMEINTKGQARPAKVIGQWILTQHAQQFAGGYYYAGPPPAMPECSVNLEMTSRHLISEIPSAEETVLNSTYTVDLEGLCTSGPSAFKPVRENVFCTEVEPNLHDQN